MFARKYAECDNGAEAARYAGYSVKTATTQGCRMLLNVYIQDLIKKTRIEIRKIEDERMLANIMTRAEIQLERSRIGRFDVKKIFDKEGNLIPITELPEDITRAIQSIEIKEKYTDPESGITTQIKKITCISKINALKDLNEFLDKRDAEAEELGIPKDSTIIENAIQEPDYSKEDIIDEIQK